MDIFNRTKFKLHIGIIIFIFITFACCTIGDCIDLLTKQNNWRLARLSETILTRGLVSIIYIVFECELVFSIHWRSCSSSRQRALKPDNGCEQRVSDAYAKTSNDKKRIYLIEHTPLGCKYERTGNRPRLRNFELPINIAFVVDVGT
jgi:hypothetical protein